MEKINFSYWHLFIFTVISFAAQKIVQKVMCLTAQSRNLSWELLLCKKEL